VVVVVMVVVVVGFVEAALSIKSTAVIV